MSNELTERDRLLLKLGDLNASIDFDLVERDRLIAQLRKPAQIDIAMDASAFLAALEQAKPAPEALGGRKK